MPPPSQLYATDRTGLIWILDPTSVSPAGSPWVQNVYASAPGPALLGFGFDSASNYLYTVGIPDGTGLNFYGQTPVLQGSNYVLKPPSAPVAMSSNSFWPESIAIDSVHKRVFVADPLRFLTVWSTDLPTSASRFTQIGSPYYPNNGPIRAQGVAYNSTSNRVYVACQNSQGQDQLAVYDASVTPMTQISGSPFTVNLSLSSSHTSIAYDSVNNHILITTSAGLVVLNATTMAQIGSVVSTGGVDPRGIALDTTNGRVYICNYGSDSLAALSASTLLPISGSPYPTGHGPKAVIYNSAKNWVYVANFNGNPGGFSVYNAAVTPMAAIAGSPFLSAYSFSNLAVGP